MRYAKAFFAYTEQEEASEEVFREMETLARNFAQEPRLRQCLLNPILGEEDKAALLKSAVGGQVTNQTWRFIQLVMRNRREEMLQAIALNYLALYRKARNIHQATLETVVPLAPATEERFKMLLSARTQGTVELIKRINPDLIGGFVFQMNFQQIDASVASQLAEIKKHFTEEYRQRI